MRETKQQAWILAAAAQRPDAVALGFDGKTWSWKELASDAERSAARLHALGLRRGDVLALRMKAQPGFVAILHAAQMLGVALLPLNLRLTAAETERLLAHAGPRLFADEDGLALALPEGCGQVDAADLTKQARHAKGFELPPGIDPDALLTIVYTSGTTSQPKGVPLRNRQHAEAAAASRRRLGHGARDRWLATLPLFHVGGLAILFRSVLEGSTVQLEGGFDLARTLHAIGKGEATMISMVPTMLARALERGELAPSPSLRCLLLGGAALSPSLGRRALDAGLPVAATYGMTEAASQICTTTPGSEDVARGSVGRPLDRTELRIRETDRDGWGEILVRGPTVAGSYLRNPEADRAAYAGGWLHTGDIGRLDEKGCLQLAGRRDDLIVSGGENVAPLEVEQVLDAHPAVSESLVLGRDDAEWGQRVVAAVVLREGRHCDAATLDAWCRERLASYKTPREIRFLEALPRGATGKVLRRLPD